MPPNTGRCRRLPLVAAMTTDGTTAAVTKRTGVTSIDHPPWCRCRHRQPRQIQVLCPKCPLVPVPIEAMAAANRTGGTPSARHVHGALRPPAAIAFAESAQQLRAACTMSLQLSPRRVTDHHIHDVVAVARSAANALIKTDQISSSQSGERSITVIAACPVCVIWSTRKSMISDFRIPVTVSVLVTPRGRLSGTAFSAGAIVTR